MHEKEFLKHKPKFEKKIKDYTLKKLQTTLKKIIDNIKTRSSITTETSATTRNSFLEKRSEIRYN